MGGCKRAGKRGHNLCRVAECRARKFDLDLHSGKRLSSTLARNVNTAQCVLMAMSGLHVHQDCRDEESGSICTCPNDEMPTDNFRSNKNISFGPKFKCVLLSRHPLINAVAAILLFLAALFILDRPNLDGLDLAHQYFRNGARRARVAIAATVPRLDAAGSRMDTPKRASSLPDPSEYADGRIPKAKP